MAGFLAPQVAGILLASGVSIFWLIMQKKIKSKTYFYVAHHICDIFHFVRVP